MARYLALINIPGYMPMADEPPVFEAAPEAWAYLAEERERGFGMEGLPEQDDAHDALTALAEDPEAGAGTVYGDTPDSESEHDLGLAYSVVLAEQRAATPEEVVAYLAGHEEFVGAEETEDGLLLVV